MKTKMVSMFVVVLIAFAITGFSYAWWTDALTISSTISTGELDVEFTGAYTTSCSEYMQCSVGFENGNDAEPSSSPVDYSKMSVMVDNGYPCGWCNVTFTIHNCGTIPAKVDKITITAANELDVTLEGLSEGDEIDVDGSVSPTLKIHINENAAELSSYTVSITIDFKQFNAP